MRMRTLALRAIALALAISVALPWGGALWRTVDGDDGGTRGHAPTLYRFHVEPPSDAVGFESISVVGPDAPSMAEKEVPSPGLYKIGKGWLRSTGYTDVTDVRGLWTFSAFLSIDDSSVSGELFARVFRHPGMSQLNSPAGAENRSVTLTGPVGPTELGWGDTMDALQAAAITPGERFLVEIWFDATSGGVAGVEVPPTFQTVDAGNITAGGLLNLTAEDDVYEAIMEQERPYDNETQDNVTIEMGPIGEQTGGGDFTDLRLNDGVVEELRESVTSPYDLDWRWVIPVTDGGASWVFYVDAWLSSSQPDDEFTFQVSLTGLFMTEEQDLLTVTSEWVDETAGLPFHFYEFSPGFFPPGSTAYLRLIDTNAVDAPPGGRRDDVSIDYLTIHTLWGSNATDLLVAYQTFGPLPASTNPYYLVANAYHNDTSGTDNFSFAYSLQGQYGPYLLLYNITNTTDEDYLWTQSIMAAGGSLVWVRITDTAPSAARPPATGNTTLFLDYLAISTVIDHRIILHYDSVTEESRLWVPEHAGIDVTSPYLVSTTPINQTTDVPVNEPVVVEFSEAMRPDAVQITSTPDPGGWVWTWNAPWNTTGTGLHDDFVPLTNYTLRVLGAQDASGNALVANAVPNPFTFTTADTPPKVTSTFPEGGALTVTTNAIFLFAFDHGMNTSSVETEFTFTDFFTTWNAQDGNPSWDTEATLFAFDPDVDLAPDTNYRIRINGSALGLNGLGLDGNGNGVWDGTSADKVDVLFRTGTAPDTEPPSVLEVRLDGLATKPQLTYEEGGPATVTLTALIVDVASGGQTPNPVGGANWTRGPRKWPGTPAQAEDGQFNGSVERISATLDVSSLGPGDYRFYVYAWDLIPNLNQNGSSALLKLGVPPAKVSQTLPQTDAQNVSMSAEVQITFDRDVDKRTVEDALEFSPDVNFTTNWTGRVLTIHFTEGLKPSTTYTLRIRSEVAEDVYGKALDGDGDGEPGGDYTLSFVTKSEDKSPPVVIPLLVWLAAALLLVILFFFVLYVIWRRRIRPREETDAWAR